MPYTVQALVDHSLDLLNVFIPGLTLLQRATSAAPVGADWLTHLKQAVAHQEANRSPTNLQQYHLFQQYTNVLHVLAQQQPILLILDDLQWADTGSINLLFHLGRQVEGSRILVLGSYRPADIAAGRDGERHPLEAVVNEFQRIFGDIYINLSQTEGRQFVDSLLDSEPNQLDSKFREALYRQTQGHALFTAEMLRGMQERGDLVQDEQGRWIAGPNLDWQTLPARIEGAIGERINRLPEPLQEMLKIASIEGEIFTAEVVAQIQGLNERQVIRQLSGDLDRQHRLVRSESSRRLSNSGQRLSQYRFRHILFQRYLYSSLDEVERAYLHEAIGATLEQLYMGRTDDVTVQLAHHFQVAGIPEKALGYLQQAGDEAVRLSAYQEAITHYSKALELLKRLRDPVQYAQQDLHLQLALGRAQIVTKGSAAPEVEHAFSQARELSYQLEETALLMKALGGLVIYYMIQGDIPQAQELAEQCLRLAQELGDPSLTIGPNLGLGTALLYGGKLDQAQTHFEQALALYHPQQSADLIVRSDYGGDPGVMAQRQLGFTKWLRGYPEQALILVRQALTLAEELDHPFSIAGSLALTCAIHYFRREAQAVKAWAEETITLSSEQGFVLWKLFGMMCRGWALAERGQAEAGIEQIQQSLEAYQDTGAGTTVLYHTLLVTAQLRIGQITEGPAILEKALKVMEQTGKRNSEAELYRLKGELLLKAEGESMNAVRELTPEDYFHKAIDIARQQGARSWELRATVSLCRLWQAQGKREEARQMLSEIYNWFTEGFDTLDLQEAKALLDELS